jgi:hypothetical protein
MGQRSPSQGVTAAAQSFWDSTVVAELESPITAIAGFCIDSVHPTHLTIVDLAVHPSQRRQGYGLKIVSKLIQKLCVHWKKEIRVDVREKNLGAQKFLYTAGFRAYGVKRGAYEDTGKDAYSSPTTSRGCLHNADLLSSERLLPGRRAGLCRRDERGLPAPRGRFPDLQGVHPGPVRVTPLRLPGQGGDRHAMLTVYNLGVLYLVIGVSAAFVHFPEERKPGDEDPFQAKIRFRKCMGLTSAWPYDLVQALRSRRKGRRRP